MTACLLWPLPEAARQLGGLSVRTVRRLIERGEIPMVRGGRRVTVPAEAVRAWVARGTKSSPCAPPRSWVRCWRPNWTCANAAAR